MSVIRSLDDAEHPWISIQQWQANVTDNATEKQSHLASHRYNFIIRLYKPALKLLLFEKDHGVIQRHLKRAFETFLFWGQQYEVSIGGLDRLIDRSWRSSVIRFENIDQNWARFDRSSVCLIPRIQQSLPEHVLETSSPLRKAGEEAIFLLTDNMEFEHTGDEASDDDSDTSSIFEDDSLSEIVEDLASNVERLMDLDALYDAAKDKNTVSEAEPVAKAVASLALVSSLVANAYTEMLQMRFPEAKYELLDYLGRASYYR
ncbi:hypothetical protein F5Y09DRAFT_342520 [Xylaria sp. FL1042]|nr:hypothetical protein F5Y09DRAFT_342520 [Xylaria sp. FL1042]